ncbi:Hypothetical_protein [Hexamita inflata]|uniref:Hypothetical_protein n=1 Tax=Hexamita inflata TaxID=28002 RepID=A0ABP1HW39_9EUKA
MYYIHKQILEKEIENEIYKMNVVQFELSYRLLLQYLVSAIILKINIVLNVKSIFTKQFTTQNLKLMAACVIYRLMQQGVQFEPEVVQATGEVLKNQVFVE